MKQRKFLSFLTSQYTAQQFLLHCYKKLEVEHPEKKSYENASAFIHFLDHGLKFYESGRKLDELVQPVLYFYGLAHLLKAYILTKRPDYPESTTHLAHGVTTRKRKKKDFSFLEDEVKVQRNGLFTYAAEYLFSITPFPFEKIKMKHLLVCIPEMNELFRFQQDERLIPVGTVDSPSLLFPYDLLDTYHVTEKAFIEKIKPFMPGIKDIHEEENNIVFQLEKPIFPGKGPFFFNYIDKNIYFPVHREDFLPLPETMIHYLLLYNLSMLCRYETEWWGEILTERADYNYLYIRHFLHITAEKVPLLIEQELLHLLGNNLFNI
jgi:hypothetical protein